MKSTDAGSTWTPIVIPTYPNGDHFTGGQGDYDLILAVHPTNSNFLYVGGTSTARSFDGGTTWADELNYWYLHPDQHAILFRPGTPNGVVLGNDGGIFYASNAGNTATSTGSLNYGSRNKDYNITQYYSIAQKNQAGNHYLLAGAQDNGTHHLSSVPPVTGTGEYSSGGDGMLCFIDQDNPNVQISSYQYNSYNLLNGNGSQIATLIPFQTGGQFVNPSDYDSQSNTLYTYRNPALFSRVRQVGTTNVLDDMGLALPGTSFIRIARTANTIFVGTDDGAVYKVTGTQQSSATPVLLNNGAPMYGNVSSINVGASDNQLMVTLSNYGVSSVWYTSNGGVTWANKDNATLPDMPIRHGILNPLNPDRALLATEIGIWGTSNFSAASPTWAPMNNALANVRCDWLHYRTSDGQVAVGTYGRGMYITDGFSTLNAPFSLTITTSLPARLCKGLFFPVELFVTGAYASDNQFQMELSNASGSFDSGTTVVATGPIGSLQVVIPDLPSIPDGSNYYLRAKASNPAVVSAPAGPFILSGGGLVYAAANPRLESPTADGFTVTASLNDAGKVYFVVVGNNALVPTDVQIKNGLNTDGKTALGWGLLEIPTANASSSAVVSGLMSGVEYDVYFYKERYGVVAACEGEPPFKREIATSGEPLAYCPPTYNYGCTFGVVIADFKIFNTNLSYQNTGCSRNAFGLYAQHRYTSG